MESTSAKIQSTISVMATTEQSYFRTELELRREKLKAATRNDAANARLRVLLADVDAALSRLQDGSFGICESCHESIEVERLISDPLLRLCLDHLSPKEQRDLENDLMFAAEIQRTLLPRRDWSVDGWEARYHYQPANVVSGDYCDLIEADGRFVFLLGDVAGKGVAASMLMSHLHATFRTLASQNLPLQQMVEHANRQFCDSTTAGQFATMIVGSAWPDGRVEYVNAGHLPLLHISALGTISREASGVPLGMFSSTDFGVCHLQLAVGDKLFLYTDGLSEAFNAAGDEFGIGRVHSMASRHAVQDPDKMLASCLSEIRGFSAASRQTDDLTLLVVYRAN
jgi:sigma-B regulation protein RsbU (phosphoserine phosphatase)